MEQDCEQSLERTLLSEPGCRFLDDNGFCYIWGQTQMYCVQNPTDVRCNDGGASWGWASTGLGSASGKVTTWEPQTSVALYKKGKEVSRYGCACLKNCACSWSTNPSCRCSEGAGGAAVGDASVEFPTTRYTVQRDGHCSCKCTPAHSFSSDHGDHGRVAR
ncbi:hypothetical protein T484DRAFT_1885934 [Baffinella frigidus]|nr:hypothetical protein T484DRAFT_1885934 [Cryptophyta sp. CCMP2293]